MQIFAMLATVTNLTMPNISFAEDHSEKPSFEQYLRSSAVSRNVIDGFLKGPGFAQFDPELGYIVRNYLPVDGIDNSTTILTVQNNGARTSFMYAGRACRINTYGDSFTENTQVSDGETWQEYLAAHLGEPIRNFGVGGYGVYQTYRRMIREEKTDHAAKNLIFYIWGDDHIRSLFRSRHANIYPWWDDQDGRLFHANFWPNLEMDLKTGRFVENESLLPTKESLYRMTDPQWEVDHLKDDLALQLSVFAQGGIRALDREKIDKLAAWLNFTFDWSQSEIGLRAQAGALLDKYSLRATRYVLDKAKIFAQQNGKKLLIVLFDPYRVMSAGYSWVGGQPDRINQSGIRYDQDVVDYLVKEKFDYFDMNEIHMRDYTKYNLSYGDYMKEYFVGHYNPSGNHFFAYSIKNKVVDWLDPKPITYQNPDSKNFDFKYYLQGFR